MNSSSEGGLLPSLTTRQCLTFFWWEYHRLIRRKETKAGPFAGYIPHPTADVTFIYREGERSCDHCLAQYGVGAGAGTKSEYNIPSLAFSFSSLGVIHRRPTTYQPCCFCFILFYSRIGSRLLLRLLLPTHSTTQDVGMGKRASVIRYDMMLCS